MPHRLAAYIAVQKVRVHFLKKIAIRTNVFLLSALLCAAHLSILTADYFKFETIALFAPYIPFEQTLPFVSICVKLPFVLDDRNKTFNSTISVQEISPAAVLKGCKIRNFTSNQLQTIQCSDGFKTSRSIRKKWYYCYAIKPKVMTTYATLDAIASLNDRRVIYNFVLSEIFDKHNEMMPLMYFRRRPFFEFSYSNSIKIGEGVKNFSLQVAYGLIEVFRLPPPYETNCIDASICLDGAGKPHPWCNQKICIDNETKTYTAQQKAKITGLSIQVEAAAAPFTRITHTPKKRPSSFILEIVSLLGFWVNFSIFVLSNSIFSCWVKPRSSVVKPEHVTRQMHPNSRHPRGNFMFYSDSGHAEKPSIIEKRAIGLLKLFLKLTVFIFFMRECHVMSSKYFEYKTHVYRDRNAYRIIEYPSISHCIHIHEWFRHKRIGLYYKIYDRMMTQYFGSFNYTLKEMFDLTPPVESAIDKCQVRDSAESPLVTTTDCDRHFTVAKFFYEQFMCYYFKPKMQFIRPGDFERDISVIYSIIPSKKLIPSYHYQSIVSYDLPSQSRLLAKDQRRNAGNRSDSLAFRTFKYKQLPAPYDTRCGQYKRSLECETECMNLTQVGLVTFSHIMTDPIDLPVLDYVYLKNSTIANFVQRAEDRCKNACPSACVDSFTVTYNTISESNYTHQITLQSPKYPVISFVAHPVYSLYEYGFQLACSASFWIGLSCYGILKLVTEFNKRKKSVPAAPPAPRMSFMHPRKLYHTPTLRQSFPLRKFYLRKVRSLLTRPVFFTSLTIGFCAHTYILASVYFKYPTCMDTRKVDDRNITQPKTSVCISIDQLDLKGDYSLHNIWAQSPASDQLIAECGHRGPNIPEFSHLPKNLRRRIMPYINSTSLCNSLFRVKKFSTFGMICYEVTPAESMTDAEYRTEYQILSARVYQYFILSLQTCRYDLIVALSHGSASHAFFMTTTSLNNQPNSAWVYYYVNNVEYRISSVPHPYDMGVYDSLKRITCMRKCIGPRMRELDVFSPYDAAMDASFLQHGSERDSLRPELINLKVECVRMCKRERNVKAINDVYFDTFGDGPFPRYAAKRWNGTVGIRILASNFLVTETTFYPEFTLVDLIIFVGSLFSVWFGQSVLQLADFLLNRIIGLTQRP